jgi:exodeoxyribonuclease VII small subunit
MTLEERLERLDAIVAELESEKLDLSDALLRFEEGVALLREAAAALAETDLRVKKLTELADGAFIVEDLERDD